MTKTYVVAPGDCVSTIAAQYGFLDWRKIWNHPDNADLRGLRQNPNVLLPGDVVRVPEPDVKVHARSADLMHSFRMRAAPVRLRLRMIDGCGRPYAQADFRIEVSTKPGLPAVASREGKTSGDGLVELQVPADARLGTVTLAPKGRKPVQELRWHLRIGHLDPPDEMSGAEARLRNLGLFPDDPQGDPARWTEAVVTALQNSLGLAPTGEIDSETRRVLERWHDRPGAR